MATNNDIIGRLWTSPIHFHPIYAPTETATDLGAEFMLGSGRFPDSTIRMPMRRTSKGIEIYEDGDEPKWLLLHRWGKNIKREMF